MSSEPTPHRKPSLGLSLVPVVFLVAALWLSVVHLGAVEIAAGKKVDLTTHVPLIFAAVVASLIAHLLGYNWQEILDGMVQGINKALAACLILLVIGLLVGSWIQSGIVPAMIYYGLELLSPSIFLLATCVICALVSLATGSSWSTAATVGIALMGVGHGLGIPKPMIAGAIISGGYFGDKMSPLSDTTNLAPAMAGANLFDHIRHMVYTTGPSLALSLILFGILGAGQKGSLDTAQVDAMRAALDRGFLIHPLLLLPPAGVIAMVILRVPPLPALMGGYALGAVLSGVVQDQSLGQVLAVSYHGVQASTGLTMVDELLNRGGLSSMFSTIILVVCALSFGGVMERAGMLEAIAAAMLRLARRPLIILAYLLGMVCVGVLWKGYGTSISFAAMGGIVLAVALHAILFFVGRGISQSEAPPPQTRNAGGVVLATVCTCLGMNVLASDQYLAIVIPGRMYRDAYRKLGLAPRNLSRTLEDSGTLTSVLIPWNTCGAYMIATLGVAAWSYVPFCFLNLINPLVSIFYGFTGITMLREKPQ